MDTHTRLINIENCGLEKCDLNFKIIIIITFGYFHSWGESTEEARQNK